MDRFKFRAWYNKKMWAWDEIYALRRRIDDKLTLTLMLPDGSAMSVCKDYVLMQCTGLKDSKGVLIYEKDILQYAELTGDKWLLDKEKTIGVVRWRDGKCGFSPQEMEQNHKGGYYFAYWDQLADVEIIGNIYENSELCS